jgi:hypothetical protein
LCSPEEFRPILEDRLVESLTTDKCPEKEKKNFNLNLDMQHWGNDHEVEFHEIKIAIFHEIKITIMRSKLCLFMRLNLSNNIDQEVDTSIMRSKPKQALFIISIS